LGFVSGIGDTLQGPTALTHHTTLIAGTCFEPTSPKSTYGLIKLRAPVTSYTYNTTSS
jgi:hypothetical protein